MNDCEYDGSVNFHEELERAVQLAEQGGLKNVLEGNIEQINVVLIMLTVAISLSPSILVRRIKQKAAYNVMHAAFSEKSQALIYVI